MSASDACFWPQTETWRLTDRGLTQLQGPCRVCSDRGCTTKAPRRFSNLETQPIQCCDRPSAGQIGKIHRSSRAMERLMKSWTHLLPHVFSRMLLAVLAP